MILLEVQLLIQALLCLIEWYIIGGCVGGAVVLAIVVAIILFAIYMKKRTPTVAGVSYKELEEE